VNPGAEWLEADGLGGFASGTVSGVRTRRYHALLLAATEPPCGRFVLVNGFDAWVGRYPISSQRYAPDVTSPDGAGCIESFVAEPWPRWRYRLGDGSTVEQELFVPRDRPAVVLRWHGAGRLRVRPFFSGRDYHALHHENTAFRFEPERRDSRFIWRPYDGVPPIVAVTNGDYAQHPEWYRNFQYDAERERGLDFTEDLASPGVFTWDLSLGPATLLFTTDEEGMPVEPARWAANSAVEAYVVRRGKGKTIVAGYPWFTDWGRDTFISMRGLCKPAEAREILLAWAGLVDRGMLPNRFPDRGSEPEFNSVDASLWFVVAAKEFLQVPEIGRAVQAILSGYSKGTRYGIRADGDGLLRAGESGQQLTWMDARVGNRVVTPRIGKPVEVQALWLDALAIGGPAWRAAFERGLKSLRERFWNEAGGCLYDVVDADHERGKVDASFRPNQIFAVHLLEPDRARRVVDAVESRILTPLGLRTLAPGEPGYCGRYEGGPSERDGAYHQGTVWPWLMGPFIEAWVRVRGGTPESKREARARFVEPLRDRLQFGHLPEIADGDAPHAPRGCPFQAWSLGEFLRVDGSLRG
jgi:predicted glycogen debranching enzyme